MEATVSLRQAQEILQAQPFSRHLGARLTEFEPGKAVIEIDIEHHHLQQYEIVHGGVLSYAADNVITFAAGTVLGASVVTGGMTISYLRPARKGILRATATVIDHHPRQAVCTALLHILAPDAEPELCAVAQGTVLSTRVRP